MVWYLILLSWSAIGLRCGGETSHKAHCVATDSIFQQNLKRNANFLKIKVHAFVDNFPLLSPSLLIGLIAFERKVPRFYIRMNHRIPFSLDRKMTTPLSVQMAEGLRAAITSGFYREGGYHRHPVGTVMGAIAMEILRPLRLCASALKTYQRCVGTRALSRASILCALFVLCVETSFAAPMAQVFTFENGGAGWTIPPAYSVMKGEGMNGSSAFVYDNADPNLPYAYPSYEVALQTGVIYRISGWIRTENLDPGARKGAQLAILCQDADGKSVAEWYSPGTKGTKDWQKIEFVTRPIPPTAVKCILLSYCTRQALGKAFFDDITVAPYEDPAVGMMFSSAYRNTAASGNVTFGVALSVPEKYSPEETKGVFSYVDAKDAKKEVSVTPAACDRAFFSLDAALLKEGDSEIAFELFAPDGTSLGTSSLTFHRPGKMPRRRVWIDEHHRTIVDGEPFFPLGMYSSVKWRRDDYVKGPFNTIASYLPLDAVEMDFFHTNGIKVIYSVKDMHPGMPERTPSTVTDEATASAYVHATVNAFRSHPALLAWYVNDESTIERFKALRMRQELLERIDPDHPTWTVLYQYDMMRGMAPTFDILGVDIYPVTTDPLSCVTAGARKTSDAMLGLRPMWHVPQSFDWGLFRDDKPGAPPYRMPTIDEMRSMSWQFIAAGANGLIYYGFSTIMPPKRKDGTPFSFDKAWADICVVAEEVRQYIPVLLSVEEPPTVTGAPEPWGVRVWRKDGDVWLLAVNAQDAPSEADLTLSEDFAAVTPAFGPPAAKTGARMLKVSLEPNEPAFYRLSK